MTREAARAHIRHISQIHVSAIQDPADADQVRKALADTVADVQSLVDTIYDEFADKQLR